MAFPTDPLDVTVELFYSGAWQDITTDVRIADGITITEGRPDEASASEPSRMSLTLDNTGGKYSPRNPSSPLFGLIGRNTPIRARIGALDPGGGLVVPGNSGSYLAAPHAAGDDITGDIDIRLELTFDEWPPRAPTPSTLPSVGLARRWFSADSEDDRGWALWLAGVDTDTPVLQFRWTTDGTTATDITVSSTTEPPAVAGTPIALRVTLDVDNGGGGYTATFFTSTAIDGTWTQLGAPVSAAGVTSIFASTAPLEVGRTRGTTVTDFLGGGIFADGFYGELRAFETRSGIDGTLVNSADLTDAALTVGTRSFTSATGDAWTVHGGAHFTDASLLFSGEVSTWPPRWDPSGKDVTTRIEASGISRRLSQGAKPLKSVVRRGIERTERVVAYWPCEEGSSAFTGLLPSFVHDPLVSFASAFSGHAPATFTGEVDPGSYAGFGAATAPIPTYGAAGRIDCIVPDYPAADSQRVMALVHVPDGGVAAETRLLAVVTSGTVRRWEIMLSAGGSLRVRAFDDAEVLVEDGVFVAFDMNGDNSVLSLLLTQDGGDIDYVLHKYNLDTQTGAYGGAADVAGETYGRVLEVHTTDAAGDLAGTAVGHIIVSSPDDRESSPAGFGIRDLLTGLTGETAADRVSRLVDEEDVPAVLELSPDLTELMGGQRIATLLDLLREAAASDLAVIGDAHDQLAVFWRARHELYAQDPALTLDYTAKDLSEPFEPEEDDQAVRNDVEVERVGGSSFRATLETGPLSIQSPPDGVGRYDESVNLSLADDDQLEPQAWWRLHLGTVDELRYPSVTVSVHRRPALMAAVNAVKVGSIIKLVNLPEWLPPGDVLLLVNHVTRRMSNFTYTVEFTCAPGGPWQVLRLDNDQRISSSTSVTAAAVGPADTTVLVDSIWTPDATHVPFDILLGGEVMTVTAVAVAGSNSTLTVTRQLQLFHTVGTPVRLASESYVGL